MANPIGWCDETINFFTGCRQGCPWCYARRMAHRLAGMPESAYARVRAASGDEFAPAWHQDVYTREQDRLTRFRGGMVQRYTAAPRRIFVGSMGDMCFEGGAVRIREGRDPVTMTSPEVQRFTAKWAQLVGCAGHAVLVLTKRPDLLDPDVRWARNVHLGVSVTGIRDDHRIATLRGVVERMAAQGGPAGYGGPRGPGVIWASVEPLLDVRFKPECLTGLDWVVVGFESSLTRARKRTVVGVDRDPTVRDVPRGVAVQRIAAWCRDHGVPVFCKGSVAAVCGGAWPQELPMVRGPHARADFA